VIGAISVDGSVSQAAGSDRANRRYNNAESLAFANKKIGTLRSIRHWGDRELWRSIVVFRSLSLRAWRSHACLRAGSSCKPSRRPTMTATSWSSPPTSVKRPSDIAVAVTAITSDAKQERGIITITDMTNVTPGLSYTPSLERVTLRGIGRLSNSIGADPGVANYNDGLYTPFAVMAGKDAQLIQRVEVLRGPQGTLYGRNAIGGAINTISKRPTNSRSTKLGAGNYD
jgi:hypothetical protein